MRHPVGQARRPGTVAVRAFAAFASSLRVSALRAFAVLALAPAAAHAQGLDQMGFDRGAKDAPVEVIEFIDLGCSQCARFDGDTYPALAREFVATGKVRWKTVVFVLGTFRHSAFAAEAAECAGEQGKIAPMADALLRRQAEWKAPVGVPRELFASIARSVRVDTAQFNACVRSERMRDRVRRHKQAAQVLGVYGTPTFFVQRRQRILGAIPGAQFAGYLRSVLAGEASP
jgi:protein-disulfide isomerase